MSQRERTYDTIIIGGGQTGMTVGYELQERGFDFVILDASERPGDTWRKRWDSLRLFTPSHYSALPGLPFPGPARTYVGKDEMADYLSEYARIHNLPIVNNTPVERLSHDGGLYEAETADGVWRGRNVVVAMADFQDPRVPEFAPDLRPDIVQLHASQYKNPSQLQPGPVLVVGVGNSGADIALELAELHHTYLAGKETAHIPFRIEGWFGRWIGGSLVRFLMTRILTTSTPIGRAVRPKMEGKASPLVRVKPKDLVRAGVERVGRITGVENGLPFAGPETPLDVANVVWCTGYRPGFGWIDLPVFDSDGRPLQNRGVVESQPGLYFVGLFFLHNPWSENLVGMPADARHVVEQLIRRRTAEVPTLTQP